MGGGGRAWRDAHLSRKVCGEDGAPGFVGGFGVNWRDEIENDCCGEFVGGDGLCGGWADDGGEAADHVCGLDGDEAGE